MNRTGGVLGGALLTVLLMATIGNAGSRPDVMLAWHGLLFVTMLLAWWVSVPGPTGRRPAAGIALSLTVLVLVLVAGLARAPYTFAAWLTLVEVAAFVAAFAIAIRTGDRLVAWLGPALVLAGWFQTALLSYQRFVEGDPRPAGTFNNPNYLAGWLAAGVLFCAGRWFTVHADRRARLSAVASLPLLAGIVITGSRGALVGIGAGALLLTILVWRGLSPSRRRVLLGGFLLVGLAGGAAVVVRLQQPDPFRYQRLKIWRASVMPLLSEPWTGTGPGQFVREAPNLQFPDGRGALRYDRGFRTTHSDWIRVGAELGWPGVVAFGWVVVATGAHLARRRREIDPGATAALGALFAQAAVDNVSRAPAMYLLGGVLFGLVAAIEGPARRPIRPFWRWLVVVAAVHLFVIGDVAPWRQWAERRAGPWPPSVSWCPADAETAIRRAEYRFAQGAGLEAYPQARLEAERAVALSPRDGELVRRLARIEVAGVGWIPLDRTGRERIVSLYRRSEALQRTNPFVPLELAAFLLDAADPAGARRAAERALEIEPEAVAPRLLLARALLEAGDPERASDLVVDVRARAARYADEARSTDYARDLLTYDPALLQQVVDGIEAARQARSGDPRFGPEDQEDRAGTDRSVD